MKFINCQIDFSKHKFSPRTETEFWVGEALKVLKSKTQNLEILDMFSGTGCIGITILKNIENAQVDFADIWFPAIEQIKINLKLNKITQSRYGIYRSDLFRGLKGKKYDFIFANPPYVALNRIFEVQKDVLESDPAVALFGGKDGMVLIEKFLNQVKDYLKPAGKIFMEFDPLQQKNIKKVLDRDKFRAEFKKDQFGKYRWLEASLINRP
jgi:release factor glutamine methyltransferase